MTNTRPRTPRQAAVLVTTGLLLLLAACTGVNAGPSTTTTPRTSAPAPSQPSASVTSSEPAEPTEGTPSSVAGGIDAAVDELAPDQYSAEEIPESQITDAIDQVDGIAADVMSKSGVPGMAVAVVHDGEVVFAKGYGVREVGKPETVDENTVFQLASVSKSIGSTVIARAVTDGTVSWSDPVVKYLPNFQLADPAVTQAVTIGDLYSHRSGIPGGAGDDLEGIGFTREQILERLRYYPLNPFRITYGYTNFGMTAGGEAVAAAAGIPWEELSAKEIYEPLGMTSTSSTYADFLTRPNRTTLHFNEGGDFEPLYIRNADAQSPAGGVSSNVTDMANWLNMNLASGMVDGEQLIDPKALLAAHTSQINSNPADEPDARSRYYGYGFNVESTSTGHVKWGHSGAFYVGAGTTFSMIPAADVGIVVLTNASPVGAAEAVATTFTDLVRTGRVERDWLAYYGPLFAGLFVNRSVVATPAPASPAPARPTADYVGTYTNQVAGDVLVTAAGDVLTVQVGPKALNAPLTHYDGDVFSWLPPGGNGDPVSAVTFAGDAAGPAQTINLEFLDGHQFGTFTRVG